MKNERVLAVVTLKSQNEKLSLSKQDISRQETKNAKEVSKLLTEAGFEIEAQIGGSISFSGPKELLESEFNATIQRREMKMGRMVVSLFEASKPLMVNKKMAHLVEAVHLDVPAIPLYSEIAPKSSRYYLTFDDLRERLNVTNLHSQQITGQGVHIVMIDSGFFIKMTETQTPDVTEPTKPRVKVDYPVLYVYGVWNKEDTEYKGEDYQKIYEDEYHYMNEYVDKYPNNKFIDLASDPGGDVEVVYSFLHPYFEKYRDNILFEKCQAVNGVDKYNDEIGHGVQVAANILAVAPDARFSFVKNISGDYKTGGLLAGFVKAMELDPKPDIITVSGGLANWGLEGKEKVEKKQFWNDLNKQIDQAINDGIVVLFACGNTVVNLEITKSYGLYELGPYYKFSINIENKGGFPVKSVTITDKVPDGFDYLDQSIDIEEYKTDGDTTVEVDQTGSPHLKWTIPQLGYHSEKDADGNVIFFPDSVKLIFGAYPKDPNVNSWTELAEWKSKIHDIAEKNNLQMTDHYDSFFLRIVTHPDAILVGGAYPEKGDDLIASNLASSFDSYCFKPPWYPQRHCPDVVGLVGEKPMGMLIMTPVPKETSESDDDQFANILWKKEDGYFIKGDDTSPNDGWCLCSGTSAATGQVAGIVALVLQFLKKVTNDYEDYEENDLKLIPMAVKNILENSATDIVTGISAGQDEAHPGWDPATGFGLVDGGKAIAYLDRNSVPFIRDSIEDNGKDPSSPVFPGNVWESPDIIVSQKISQNYVAQHMLGQTAKHRADLNDYDLSEQDNNIYLRVQNRSWWAVDCKATVFQANFIHLIDHTKWTEINTTPIEIEDLKPGEFRVLGPIPWKTDDIIEKGSELICVLHDRGEAEKDTAKDILKECWQNYPHEKIQHFHYIVKEKNNIAWRSFSFVKIAVPDLRFGFSNIWVNPLLMRVVSPELENLINPFLFSGLIARDGLTGNPVSDIAATWNVSEDNLTYVFHLRDGVTFHDGTPVAAKDIAFTYQTMMDPDFHSLYCEELQETIDGVNIVDNHNIAFKLKRPMANFLTAHGRHWILPEHMVKEIGFKKFLARPVGSGPFTFESGRSEDYLTLAAYADYYLGRAQFDRVFFLEVPDVDRRLDLLSKGRADIAIFNYTPEMELRGRELPHVNTFVFPEDAPIRLEIQSTRFKNRTPNEFNFAWNITNWNIDHSGLHFH